jgi:hypothetical protein
MAPDEQRRGGEVMSIQELRADFEQCHSPQQYIERGADIFDRLERAEGRVEALQRELSKSGASPQLVDIVFDGPPGPESGRFVEVEDMEGASISYGEWVKRPDGLWALRIPTHWHTYQDATRQRATSSGGEGA